MAMDYKDKIRKLLALAESPEENEAKSALLKARELMAEHKLTEAEVKDMEKQPVENIRMDLTCSKRRNPWMIDLSAVIGKNYCCQAYRHRDYGNQLYNIGFIGLKDDVEICAAVFKYTVDCILSKNKSIKKEHISYSSEYIRRLCDSYGYGFTDGMSVAFLKQKKENEQGWGLVMVIPKEVSEAAKSLRREKFDECAEKQINHREYKNGYLDGSEFDPTKRLAEA